jgi:hypothetical protein
MNASQVESATADKVLEMRREPAAFYIECGLDSRTQFCRALDGIEG